MAEKRMLFPVRDSELVWRLVDDEMVIVRPSDGQIRVLNDIGSFIWQLLDGRRTISDLACLVRTEYEVSQREAEDDIRLFLAPLIQDGIVCWANSEI